MGPVQGSIKAPFSLGNTSINNRSKVRIARAVHERRRPRHHFYTSEFPTTQIRAVFCVAGNCGRIAVCIKNRNRLLDAIVALEETATNRGITHEVIPTPLRYSPPNDNPLA